jgi:hypothetical protein
VMERKRLCLQSLRRGVWFKQLQGNTQCNDYSPASLY